MLLDFGKLSYLCLHNYFISNSHIHHFLSGTMRNRKTQNGLTVNAIAGTNVVLLGLNLAQNKRKNCLGFSIRRTDKTEGETYWMRGMKTFDDTVPSPGVSVSSEKHPFQSFQWSDYSVKESHEYVYEVFPMYLKHGKRTHGKPTVVEIVTESADDGVHCVHFNRGAAASQEYARRFKNRKPEDAGPQAYEWLSRGLLESIQGFIRRAEDSSYGIYGAIYEFELDALLQEISDAAKKRKATVKIIYDATNEEESTTISNLEAIAKYKLKKNTKPRTNGSIMHNKFLVLTKNKKPIAVLTGPTNWTINGVFGHSNCCHIVNDAKIAQTYLDYWQQLSTDDNKVIRSWNKTSNQQNSLSSLKNRGLVFSPTTGIGELQNLASIAANAKDALFMTFAFGMHNEFQNVYKLKDTVLRVALMEKEGHATGLEQGKKDIRAIRKRQNVLVAVGNTLTESAFDRWLQEMDRIESTVNVRFIHTKYMLVDPLGKSPIVVAGTANFSKAGVDTNDENILIVKGDTRVADIYMGEFMRLYSHYAFREAVKINRVQVDEQGEWTPRHLDSTDKWQKEYYLKTHSRSIRRIYFS